MFLAQLLKIVSRFFTPHYTFTDYQTFKKRVTKQKINIADKLRQYGSIFLHE